MSLGAENMPELKSVHWTALYPAFISISRYPPSPPFKTGRSDLVLPPQLDTNTRDSQGSGVQDWMVHDWLRRKVNTLCCGFQVNHHSVMSCQQQQSLLSVLVNKTSPSNRALDNLLSFKILLSWKKEDINFSFYKNIFKILLQQYLSCNYQEKCEL